VNEDCLKLTAYYGERHRVAGRFVADALLDVCERHALQGSVLLRGAEGFGLKHHLRTDRQLTLSEDLPLVTTAIDARDRIEGALPEIRALMTHGLLTLERARMLTGEIRTAALPVALGEEVKLTLVVGRQERRDGRPAYLAAVDVLHRHGLAGAIVLLGVDGTAHGVRRRARFFGANADVPMLVIGVGDAASIAAALPQLGAIPARPLVTLERVRVLKRDGRRLAQPRELPDGDGSGLALWQKLMVYAGEQSRAPGGHPLHATLVRRLRQSGARGATTLRGIWGYHGDHPPHGDRLLALRRHVPMVTVIVDAPERIRASLQIVDELTADTGLVTSEIVPALHSAASGASYGGLRLGDLGGTG
jgi:PII-like signaling protein